MLLLSFLSPLLFIFLFFFHHLHYLLFFLLLFLLLLLLLLLLPLLSLLLLLLSLSLPINIISTPTPITWVCPRSAAAAIAGRSVPRRGRMKSYRRHRYCVDTVRADGQRRTQQTGGDKWTDVKRDECEHMNVVSWCVDVRMG